MMERYIATFHTHLAALRSYKALEKRGITAAQLAPVPRRLSSSCGTCLFYESESPLLEAMDRDTEAVYRQEDGGYTPVFQGN